MAKRTKKPAKARDLTTKKVTPKEEKAISGGRDPASGLPTGQRMHKPFVAS